MHRNPAANADTDRADLGLTAIRSACPDPHAPIGPPRFDAEIGQCIDHPTFDGMNKPAHVAGALAKIEDEVADALAGTVVGVAPASSGLDDIKTGIEQFVSCGTGSSCIDRLVLEQPDEFTRPAFLYGGVADRHVTEGLTVRYQVLSLPDFCLIRNLHGPCA